jgi:hydroxymethylpyrimidine pyrophosphatase-like HAD family hydrolase
MKIDFKSPYCEKVTFGAGKTTLYSDFDGTYMPFSHKNVCKKDGIVDRDSFDRVFVDFKQFSDKKGEKFSFNITSGRNLYEFLYFLDCLKKKDLNVPLPSKVISSNGADIFELSPEGQYISSELFG